MAKKNLKIQLTRGRAAASARQDKVLDSLGLKKSQSIVYHDSSPYILGMIDKVKHLVSVVDKI